MQAIIYQRGAPAYSLLVWLDRCWKHLETLMFPTCVFHVFCDGLDLREADWLEKQNGATSVYNVLCYTVTL